MSRLQAADERAAIDAAIAALQAQRAVLGEAVVAVALVPLQQRLAELDAASATPATAAVPSAAPEPERQRLRQVSVLFADVTGSTTLASTLDPEAMHEIMDQALVNFTQVVQQQGGRVLQYAGDGMLAAFGADAVREDDAARAVACGLALLRVAEGERERVRTQWQRGGFGLRVGVHTGPVLLGGGVNDEGSIRGLTVHLAARMEQSAPHGSLRVSLETWRLVRGLFDAEEQPPLQVKGSAEPLRTWLVSSAAAPRFANTTRGIAGLEVPLVGRDAELQRLQQAFDDGPSSGQQRVAVVLGEAGIGKSRLMRAFGDSLPAGTALWCARAQPALQLQPYGLWRALLLPVLGVTASDSPLLARAHFEAAVLPRLLQARPSQSPLLAQAQTHVLGQLLGLDFSASRHLQGIAEDGAQIRSRALQALADLLRSEGPAAQPPRPVVLLLDDLQVADEASLDLLALLLPRLAGVPLLWVLAARPEFAQRRATWPAAAPNAPLRLELGPLLPPADAALAEALLQHLPPQPGREALRHLLLGRAEGNPFYMEELLAALVDRGFVDTAATPWRLLADIPDLAALPGTLVALLQSRLDALQAAERRALQQASVAGQQFAAPALECIDPAAPLALPALALQGVVRPLDDEGGSLHSHAFTHQLMHQVTYETVLKAQRRTWHARVAEWLAAQDDSWSTSLAGVVAAHHEAAEQPALAAAAYTNAAEQALAQFAHASVLAFSERALALAETDALRLRWRAWLARQRSLRLQGRTAELPGAVAELARLADALGDPRAQAVAALRHAVTLRVMGDSAGCVAACEQSLPRVRAAGDTETTLSLLIAWAGALRTLGRYDESDRVAAEGLALARGEGYRVRESELLTGLAAAATQRGRPQQAVLLLQESLRIDEHTGRQHDRCTALVNLGDACLHLGELDEAVQHLTQALALAQDLGIQGVTSFCRLNLATAELFRGHREPARVHAEAALTHARQSGDATLVAFAELVAGHVALAGGRGDAARMAYTAAAATLRAHGLPHLALEADAALARVQLADGSFAGAGQTLEAVLAALAEGSRFDGCEHPLWMMDTAVATLQALGDPRADAVLSQALQRLDERLAALSGTAARQRLETALPYLRDLRRRAAGATRGGSAVREG